VDQLKVPPARPSDEATREQLQLAKAQGDTLAKALEHMTQQETDAGTEKQAGDYLVGYAVEKRVHIDPPRWVLPVTHSS
jgi:hypothetical protein